MEVCRRRSNWWQREALMMTCLPAPRCLPAGTELAAQRWKHEHRARHRAPLGRSAGRDGRSSTLQGGSWTCLGRRTEGQPRTRHSNQGTSPHDPFRQQNCVIAKSHTQGLMLMDLQSGHRYKLQLVFYKLIFIPVYVTQPIGLTVLNCAWMHIKITSRTLKTLRQTN